MYKNQTKPKPTKSNPFTMSTLTGFPLFFQQFKALFKKNFLLSWKHKTATFLQLFSSLFFILLMFIIKLAMDARFSSSTEYSTVRDPKPLVSPSILPCEDKFYVNLPCIDFVWSGNDSVRVQRIVSAIKKNNPGRAIPSNKVISFRTKTEVDEWLFDNPLKCPGALHFVDRNATVISYGIQTNSTSVARRGLYEDPTFKFQIPLQIAAEREIARSMIGDPSFSWVVGLKEFAHPARELFNVVGSIGPSFFLAAAMFGLVFQIGSLVTEKELKLRQAMTMMGLYDSAYWLSWLSWEGIITLFSSLFIVLFGMMFQFDFFLNNGFAVLFFVFFLFELNMTGYAFMFSSLISKSSSSTTVVTISGFPYSEQFSNTYRIIWSLFPPNLLAEALKLFADATSSPGDIGISWSRRAECAPNDTECVITIGKVEASPKVAKFRIKSMLISSCWLVLFIFSCIGSVPPLEHITPDDEDVLEEENIVKQQSREGVEPNVAVQIRGLVKTYPGTRNIGCCKCKKTSPFHAVKGLSVNIAKDQLFCLLGPNGAGKTTTISCLTGITPVTGGDALIYGNSIGNSVGMSKIRKIIGVCPQFDILWNALSGEEHLHLFASIKGLPPDSIKLVTENSLAEVRLTKAAKVRAGSYSGGMKRRLSVAIALIGDPKLVILDEPTTGMDPITRRHVWDIIQDAKKGRAIILTTHSMEEADILSDRIGIMAKGRLRCIGTSIRLKSRFGTGFVANVSFTESKSEQSPSKRPETVATPHHDAVKQFFKNHLDVVPKEENKAFLTYIIPHDREELLTELQDREREFGIADIQLGLSTLEEVFLNIAKQAELDNAAAEGRLVTLNLSSGALIEIPPGARFVGIPGTETAENPRGIMVEVYWQQDDSGALCISGHSTETPIPPNVQSLSLSASTSRRRFLGQRRPIHGVVLDPSQIDATTSS
ncbi:hypothetical protein Patl1_17825 [Pistacia atlantica]|uniref:Uncharacterized protein n=1 Tax=Pistacia atlantica TaxID=434234 RepID=A0ACC1C3I3_9ROSI|nr:hypothetical protein Patl1_17825 [Pistacia atlantica]